MIEGIKMDKIACYKKAVTLKTNKRVNLIYGLNGTGESIISDFLYYYRKPEKSKNYQMNKFLFLTKVLSMAISTKLIDFHTVPRK
ncbi:hypothetical protein ATZ36_15575 [Candidatus Endomicrobiellum trichonymphae]|jgi:hypothetical protein|uniref:Rad50/SbcC-type AAA domain-containing protein n=1 Tax=Endomicrobium trichonymphae TaxID=1408204 RepID=A0A1E5IL56_ENDTX|nr:hypothetical protein ATZ36_15575 [Candidatus Endomicrobium trichonymphae]